MWTLRMHKKILQELETLGRIQHGLPTCTHPQAHSKLGKHGMHLEIPEDAHRYGSHQEPTFSGSYKKEIKQLILLSFTDLTDTCQ